MLALHNQEAGGAGNPSLGAQFGVAGEPPAVEPGIFTTDKRRSNGKRDGWSALVFVEARSACICVYLRPILRACLAFAADRERKLEIIPA